MDIRQWWTRWRASMGASSAGQINVADVNVIHAATGVRPLTALAATAANKYGKRRNSAAESEKVHKAKAATARSEKISSQVSLDAVTRVQDKVGHG